MIKKAILGSALAWLASFLILAGFDLAHSLSPGISWSSLGFFAAWTGVYLAITCIVVAVPLYCWAPSRVRRWGSLLKAIAGASAGALLFMALLPGLTAIKGALIAATVSGCLIGVLLPRGSDKADLLP